MQVAARTGAWTPSGAPLPYLRRVAYLESHGTEYIEIPAPPFEDQVWDIDLQIEDSRMYGDAFGLRGSAPAIVGDFVTTKSKRYVGNTQRFQRLLYKIDCKNSTIHLNGYPLSLSSFSVSVKTDGAIFLFCAGLNGQNKLMQKFYGCSCLHDVIPFCKYIPVLDLSGRPAMYDEVSGRFFYNQGTGEFTWGELGEE